MHRWKRRRAGRKEAIKQICAAKVHYSGLCQAACPSLTEKVKTVLRGLGTPPLFPPHSHTDLHFLSRTLRFVTFLVKNPKDSTGQGACPLEWHSRTQHLTPCPFSHLIALLSLLCSPVQLTAVGHLSASLYHGWIFPDLAQMSLLPHFPDSPQAPLQIIFSWLQLCSKSLLSYPTSNWAVLFVPLLECEVSKGDKYWP